MGRVGHASIRRIGRIPKRNRKVLREKKNMHTKTPATIPEVISLVEANEQNDRPVELSPEDLGKMNIAESTTTPIVEEPDEDPRNTWALRQMQRPIRLDEIPAGQAAVRVKRGDMTFEICGSFLCSRCDSNNTRCFQRTSKCVYCCAHESCEIK